MTDFEQQIIDLAHTFGWKVAHFRAAQTKHGWRTPVAADGKGFPDLVLVGHGQVLFRELKSQRDGLSDDQREWGEVIALNGGDWSVWRPSDLPAITSVLSAGRAVALGARPKGQQR